MAKTNAEEFDFQEYDVLWQLFYRTTRLVDKIRQKELKEHNVRADAAVVLFTIIRQGETATASSVARELFLEPNSVSEQFSRMQRKGLIRRVKNPQNRKQFFIEVTQKGYETYFISARQFSTRSVLGALSEPERKKLWTILVKMRKKALELSDVKTNDYVYPPIDPSHLEDELMNISKIAKEYQQILGEE